MPGLIVSELTDERLVSAVRSAINASVDLDPLVIAVECRDGVISLRGEVASFAQRVGAAELAEGCVGVQAVQNLLSVRPFGADWAVADETIKANIESAFRDLVSGYLAGSIVIEVNSHVVTLTGTVPTEDARRMVRHVAESVRGVDFLRNHVSVG